MPEAPPHGGAPGTAARPPTSDGTAQVGEWELPRRLLRRFVLVVVAAVALVGLTSLLPFWAHIAGAGSGAYLLIFLTIVGDALFPVLPGETALAAGSTAAAQGNLVLVLVILAGGFAAVAGDSSVYWIARSVKGPWHDRLMRAASHEKAKRLLTVFADRAPMMVVFGRYIPGVRLVVNVTMGAVVRLPYPRFLLWSSIAGFTWSAYTCILAYVVASVLSSLPLASMVISGLITTAALAMVLGTIRRGLRAARLSASEQPASGSRR